MYSMPLNQLLSVISMMAIEEPGISEELVSALVIDSRDVTQGALFIAYPGFSVDGRDYIEDAQAAGAVAILYEGENYELSSNVTIPAYAVNGLQKQVGVLADVFYRQPSSDMQVFGVTGTNGKTTCCYLLTQALTDLGMKAAMIGTIGVGLLSDMSDSLNTTPDAISVHRLLAQWRDQGITQVSMEVSSHALDQGRVCGVQFYCTLFTNLSHDHLDYHGDMASYRKAKQQLFTEFSSELVITNSDDEMGAGLIDLANSEFISSYGLQNGDVRYDDLVLNKDGMSFTIETSQMDFEVTTALIGQVNIPNILMLVTTLLSLSVSVEEIQKIVANLQAAPGRMELYASSERPSVVIDYAHTPDALEKALESIDKHCAGNLWCVFGCGGDRDKAKRPLMGQAVAKIADHVVVTNDNPRSEAGEKIAAQIVAGIAEEDKGKTVEIVLDRAEAINYAINSAASDDWVLVAGKGHETTQQNGDKVIEFSDRNEVTRILGVAA